MLDDILKVISAFVILALVIIQAWWWLPQKWQGCQKIYDNRPAQIMCFLSE